MTEKRRRRRRKKKRRMRKKKKCNTEGLVGVKGSINLPVLTNTNFTSLSLVIINKRERG